MTQSSILVHRYRLVAAKMTAEQIAETQRRAREWDAAPPALEQ